MKTLSNKISFHIPGFKYVEGKMLNIYLDDFKAALNKELEKVGIEAFYAEKERLPIKQTAGRISGEFVMAYPPGIPILAPGEEITKDIIDYILYSVEKGCSMQGMEDSKLEYLNVLKL